MKKRMIAVILSGTAVFGLLFGAGAGGGSTGAAGASSTRIPTCLHIRHLVTVGYCR
jgi:hypothetical protein